MHKILRPRTPGFLSMLSYIIYFLIITYAAFGCLLWFMYLSLITSRNLQTIFSDWTQHWIKMSVLSALQMKQVSGLRNKSNLSDVLMYFVRHYYWSNFSPQLRGFHLYDLHTEQFVRTEIYTSYRCSKRTDRISSNSWSIANMNRYDGMGR